MRASRHAETRQALAQALNGAVRDTQRTMPDEFTAPDLVEMTRRAFEPTMSRDIDGIMSFYGPDAVWDLSTGGLGVFRGRAAIREFMEDWFRSYDRIEMDLEEVVHIGSGVTFAVGTQKGRLAGSGGEVTIRYAVINVWVDGLIERSTNYVDIDEARAAAERLAQQLG
jgi:ketosteroid isomerase-like protein